jgi:hypothetical protein
MRAHSACESLYADRDKEPLALINDVPTPKDFFDSGIELFDFAWDTVANLITNFSQAVEMGVEEKDVTEEYWAASKRRLTTALAMTQQGVEFVLKGKIAEVSPFLGRSCADE